MDNHPQKLDSPNILLVAEFGGALDTWSEFLCLERNADGTVTLSSRSQILGDVPSSRMTKKGEAARSYRR